MLLKAFAVIAFICLPLGIGLRFGIAEGILTLGCMAMSGTLILYLERGLR